jgi:hypothetical protein
MKETIAQLFRTKSVTKLNLIFNVYFNLCKIFYYI